MNRQRFGPAIAAVIGAACVGVVASQAPDAPIAVRGGRIVTAEGDVIERGTVVIRNGRIEAVGPLVEVPAGATLIEAGGHTVLPGLIDGLTSLGTFEIESLGRDDDEATGAVMPHLRVIDALNPESRYFALARRAGVTAAVSAPGEGNLLSGQSALIALEGASTAAMVLKAPAAIHGSLGEPPKLRYGPKGKLPSTRMGEAALLRQTLIDARHYLDTRLAHERKRADQTSGAGTPPAVDLKLEALVPVLRGQLPLVLGASRQDDILTVLRIADEFGLKVIVSHGSEAYRVAPELAKRHVPVILGPASAEHQRIETMGATAENAAALDRAGVTIAFQTGSAANVAALVDQARRAVSGGLPYAAAVRALTLNPARIYGESERMGSLAAGKRADLVVFTADPLLGLAAVKLVMIGGRVVESEGAPGHGNR